MCLAVRDRLRGVVPKDFDIATSARPDQILALYPRGDTIGAHFGVILVRRGGHHFESATFREDGTYEDGRRPESVTFSTSEGMASLGRVCALGIAIALIIAVYLMPIWWRFFILRSTPCSEPPSGMEC